MTSKKFVVGAALVALLVLLWVAGSAIASPPREGSGGEKVIVAGTVASKISYQGRVTVEGEPFHGDGLFKFAIVDTWGNSTWSNDGTSVGGSEPVDAVPLPVTDGLFNVLLGDPNLGMPPLDAGAFVDPGCVLRVWFSPDGWDFVQLDDRPIASVPYAFVADEADTVDGWHADEFALQGHDHWGGTWSGSGTGLTLNSSGGAPALNISSGDNDGIYVPSAGGDGVEVHAAGQDGFYVGTAGDDGMQIGFQTLFGDYYGSADDGIVIYDAGNAPTHTLPADTFYGNTNDGIDIAGATHFGLWVGYVGGNGVHVESAGSNGVYVGNAGQDGVYVQLAGGDGVFANTTNTNNEFGFYTPDKIQAMNVTMRSLSIIARNDGPMPLQAGDLVAVTGVDRPLLGGGTPMPNVRRADGRFTGVIGVVESRMELTVVDPTEEWAERGEAPPNVKPEDVIHEEPHSVAGDAAPGEYVSIVVFGITDVKVDAAAGAIELGQRLTAADLAGHARALRSKLLDGMAVTEGAPVMGIALEPLKKGTGTIPVFVMLQ